MQAFGIEIRKKDRAALYRDVDLVLKNSNFKTIQANTISHVIQNMVQEKNHFSVCEIDACASIACITIPIERKKIYNSIHCLDWNKMEPEYRQQIIAMVLDDFRSVLNSQV